MNLLRAFEAPSQCWLHFLSRVMAPGQSKQVLARGEHGEIRALGESPAEMEEEEASLRPCLFKCSARVVRVVGVDYGCY